MSQILLLSPFLQKEMDSERSYTEFTKVTQPGSDGVRTWNQSLHS